MSETSEQVYELILRARGFNEGDTKIALLEEAVRLADTGGDLKLRYLAREEFMHACVFGGAPEKATVAFSWCLAQFDRNPGQFSEWSILWRYKWIVNSICEFPQIPKSQIYEMVEDMAGRFERAGYGQRVVYHQRYRLEEFWGNREEAIRCYRLAEQLPRDSLSNCAACETDDGVSFAFYCGEDERGVRLAAPILAGRQTCASVPHRTLAKILLPLVRLGRQREALAHHVKGYRLISDNRAHLDRLAEHLVFLALTENTGKGVKLIERHYPWTERNANAANRFDFYRAAWLLLDSVADAGRATLKVRLPASFPLHDAKGRYETAQLARWFKEQADHLARLFDARNETDHFARTLAETPALKKLIAPFPLKERMKDEG